LTFHEHKEQVALIETFKKFPTKQSNEQKPRRNQNKNKQTKTKERKIEAKR